MTIYVFGNPDLPEDALPLRLVPKLRQRFPSAIFEIKDPNEEWDVPQRLVVIDTVRGIENVQVFAGLDVFSNTPRITMHDFDALMQMRLLLKIEKLKEVMIIGVPPNIDEQQALKMVTAELLHLTAQSGIV